MQNPLDQDKCRSLLLDALRKGKGTHELATILHIPEKKVADNIKILKHTLEKQAKLFGISIDDYLATLR